MSLFLDKEKDYLIEGFVSSSESESYFPVIREIKMKIFSQDGHIYFRTREVSDLLGYKQPFQFVSTLKKHLGSEAVLKGPATQDFRDVSDSDQSTFIEAGDLLTYLKKSNKYYSDHTNSIYEKTVQCLEEMVGPQL